LRVEEIAVADTYDLRRRVLRDGRPDAVVVFGGDDRPGAFHLGIRNEGSLLAVASFNPEPAPSRPGRRAVRLRGMAVDPACQRRGLGGLLMDDALGRLRGDGVEVLWANARDSALGFYRRFGMEMVGDGFVTPETGLPHHVVVTDLGPSGR
jgi:GNAT superfamily N-acetyltransferase